MPKSRQPKPTGPQTERAVLVAVGGEDGAAKASGGWTIRWSSWTTSLRSAGAEVVATVSQRADRLTPTYVGKGKLQELQDVLEEERPDVVICDDELTPYPAAQPGKRAPN